MATAREYFETARRTLTFDQERALTLLGRDEPVKLAVSVAHDFEAGAKYVRLYLDAGNQTGLTIEELLPETARLIAEAEDGLQVSAGLHGHGEAVHGHDLRFTGRVIVHTPVSIDMDGRAALLTKAAQCGLALIIRDAGYVSARNANERPRAFISHDSRDKPVFVAELARRLQALMCPVWYDEFSLRAGDSLRESIESGLRETPACIVVLSPRYFENAGWARREFDTIYTREVVNGGRIMLPVWLEVDIKQVYEFSPILADRVGIPASLGHDEVARRLFNALPPTG